MNYFKHSNFNLLFRNKTLKPNIIDKMHMYLQITFNCVIKCFVFKNLGLKLNIKHEISAEIIIKYLIFKCNIDILASKYLTKYIVI